MTSTKIIQYLKKVSSKFNWTGERTELFQTIEKIKDLRFKIMKQKQFGMNKNIASVHILELKFLCCFL